MQATAALKRILAGRDLSAEESESLFAAMMDGDLEPLLTAALLTALASKGEAAEEIRGAAKAMRARVVPIATRRKDIVDTCGTGGDSSGSINISTGAAIVAAAAGVPIAKHGNRSVSSQSGSADVLEELGVRVEVDPEHAGEILDRIGIAFLFAPNLHPAMGRLMPIRRALGVRTIFNILGPLANPAHARRQVLGVYDAHLVRILAEVLSELGCDHGLVVRGEDGLDELTITGSSAVAEILGDEIRHYTIVPEDVGLARALPGALSGGSPARNAKLLLGVLRGDPSPRLDVVLLNAGAAIYVAGRSENLAAGVDLARKAVTSGAALDLLESLRRESSRASHE